MIQAVGTELNEAVAGTKSVDDALPPHRSPQRRSKASPSPGASPHGTDHPTKGAMTT